MSSHVLVFLQAMSTICDYQQPLNNFGDIVTTTLYDTDSVVTATLAITVEDDVTLLYVGYTNGGVHSLAAVSAY